MKKEMTKWKAFFLAVLTVLPLVLGTAVFILPSQFDETYLGEFREKRKRLEEINGKKMIIVGGSSVAFGIRSDLMEKELNIPVINWGLYAPLGSKTMLEMCFDEIGKGDLVIFSPEQNSETLSFAFQAEAVWKAVDGNFSMLRVFREEEQKKLLGSFPEFAISKLRYFLKGKPEIIGIYRKDSFNEYGEIANSERKRNRMPEGYDTTQLIDFSYFPQEDFVKYLNEYASRVRRKGAEFYFRFCPMNRAAVINLQELDIWYNKFEKIADFSILGNPYHCVMDKGWFFDTNFHLNESGAILNTYNFIRDVKAEFRDSTVTEIELPDMPEFKNEIIEADNRDADCFLYEEKNGTWMITGISEEGRKRKELAFPGKYKNKRVTAIQRQSLTKCEKLKKVKIYGGMSLQDGCFEGCRTLSEIVLYGRPSEIAVGQNLLDGSDALIYTKYDEEYRLDYSWSLYSDKIKKNE